MCSPELDFAVQVSFSSMSWVYTKIMVILHSERSGLGLVASSQGLGAFKSLVHLGGWLCFVTFNRNENAHGFGYAISILGWEVEFVRVVSWWIMELWLGKLDVRFCG